jgi:hypothetical protein
VPLVGEIAGISLSELLQVAALAAERSLLQIRSGAQTAWIGFEAGAIVRVARSNPDPAGAKPPGPASDEKADDSSLADAETQLLELLGWSEGKFALHCSSSPLAWPGPQGLVLPVPLRPESIALEAARRADEQRRAATPAEPVSPGAGEAATPAKQPPAAVIIVDPEMALLEAMKQGLSGSGLRVHVFSRSEEAWFRIQQYLRRGAIPALVLGVEVRDPVEPGYRPGWHRFAGRLRRIAPGAPVVLLSPEESPASTALHAVVRRPPRLHRTSEQIGQLVGTIERVLGLGA